jgi:hypothetical protein
LPIVAGGKDSQTGRTDFRGSGHLGTDNGTAYTSRGFGGRLAELEIAPVAAAIVTSSLRPSSSPDLEAEECIISRKFEIFEQARDAIGAYVESYHHWPHSGLGYRTSKEMKEDWEDAQESEAATTTDLACPAFETSAIRLTASPPNKLSLALDIAPRRPCHIQ